MMIIVTPTGTTSSTRMSTGALTKGRLRGGLPRHCVQPVEITAARCGTVLVLSLITNSVAAAVPPDNSSTAQVMTPAAQATSGVPRLVSFGFEPRLPLTFPPLTDSLNVRLVQSNWSRFLIPKHLESHRSWVYTTTGLCHTRWRLILNSDKSVTPRARQRN